MSHVPAEAWPAGHFMQEEMDERNWTSRDVALRMGSATLEEVALNQLIVEMTLAIDDPDLILDADTARKFGLAFGTSAELWLNLDTAWRDWCAAKASDEPAKGRVA